MNIYQHLINELGDQVYFKCCDSDEWKGPGIVVGNENKQMLVKHGGQDVSVHPRQLQLRTKDQSISKTTTNNEVVRLLPKIFVKE